MGENCSTCYSLLSLLFTYERCDIKQSGGEEAAYKRYCLMLIFVEGANCRCLHFYFLEVNALNLFLVQVPCTWTEFEVVAWQCDTVWSRKVNQDSSDLIVIVFSLILLNRSFVV